MAYRSTDKTRQKKDAKRTAMMQAAVQVFADKGYYAATIRDIVGQADVAIGTFYFYFPDKETLFLHLYEETAEFLLLTIRQAINGRHTLNQQVQAAINAYVNLAIYEPAIIHLLLVGGVGAVPSLTVQHRTFRREMMATWQRPISSAIDNGHIPPQNSHHSAAAVVGAIDEVILDLLNQPEPDLGSQAAARDLTAFILRALGFNPE